MNAWKKAGTSINLVDSGGHCVEFEGQKVFPESFILRHYILLSRAHALEKYGKRVFSEDGIRRGWHGARATFKVDRLSFPKLEQ